MESQVSKYKEAIIEVLLKRIIPLEQQLDTQAQIISDLCQSLESLTKILTVNEVPVSNRPSNISSRPSIKTENGKRNSLQKYEEKKTREDSQKAAELQELKKAFSNELGKLRGPEIGEERRESLKAGEPESEIEDEIDREEELQMIDIELSQLAEFDSSEVPEFFFNDSALRNIGLLDAMSREDLLLSSAPPKIKWILRLFWAVQGKELDQDKAVEAWNGFIEGSTGKLDTVFYQMRGSFDFSMENLDKIETLLKKRKGLLDPSLFKYSIVGYHLMAIVKNVIEHSGVVPAASGSRYKRLVYKKESGEKI